MITRFSSNRLLILVAILLLIGACNQTSSLTNNTWTKSDLEEVTIDELHGAYRDGTVTCRLVIEMYLDRINQLDDSGPHLNAIIQINPDALSIADALDKEIKNGQWRGPLHGIPVVLKDNIDTHDKMFNSAGSRIMQGSKPLKDAYITKRLREEGAVILGKANLSEWANFHSSFSSSGWSSLGGQTKNPYDLSRNPCGSSSGSGVAVSANLTVVAIGTETNGSITCPSNNNGIVGIKPTVGLLSRSGIIPISHTQDTPGPMTRTVRDAAIALGAMVGIDSSDEATLASENHLHKDYTDFLDPGAIKGKRIGFYNAPMGRHWQVDSLMYRAIRDLEAMGATIVEVDKIEGSAVGSEAFQVLLYEFKAGMDEYLAGLGDQAPAKTLRDLVEKTLADSISMRYFDHSLLIRASKLGDLQTEEYKDALEKMLDAYRTQGMDKVMNELSLDAIVSPTGGPAWTTDLLSGDKFHVSSSSPAARSGYPSVTLPMGNIHGLPVNISFFGRAWSEGELLGMAFAYEQKTQHRIVPQFKPHIP